MINEYTFDRYIVGWLSIHESLVSPGSRHLKTFIRPTYLADQPTLNIYLKGSFKYTTVSYEQIFVAGQSSLDLPNVLIPAGKLISEEPLEENSVRVCIQPIDKTTAWAKTSMIAKAGTTIAPTNGYVIRFIDGKLLISESFIFEKDEKIIVVNLK